MKFIFLLTLIASVFAHGEAPPEATLKRLEALTTETIPHLHLNEASFDEALNEVERTWKERHPNEPLPIASVDFLPPENRGNERITLELWNAPYVVAFYYIGQITNRTFSLKRAIPQFERGRFEQEFVTEVHQVSAKSLKALNLRVGATSAEVRLALMNVGVELGNWEKPILSKTGKELFLTSEKFQQEQLSVILNLLGKGFKIAK